MTQRASKYKDYNRRVLLLLIGSLAGLGTVVFAGVGIGVIREHARYGAAPVELTAAEFVENGPGPAQWVRITGLQLARVYFQEEKARGRVSYWLAAAPAADPPLAEQPDRRGRIFFLRIPGTAYGPMMQRIEAEGVFTGVVEEGPVRWNTDANIFFHRNYTAWDVDNAYVVRQLGPTTPEELWVFGILVAIGVGVTAYCFLRLWWKPSKTHPKPPPLPRH